MAEEEHQKYIEAIHEVLIEDGFASEFFPYGSLAACTVIHECQGFNITMESGIVLVKAANTSAVYDRGYNKEFLLADPDLFHHIANHIRNWRPPAPVEESVSKRLDNAQRHQVQMGGYGHAFH